MAYLIVGLLFAVLVAIFALQNAVPVTITFLFWVFPKIELVLVILFSAFLGAMFMFILSLSQIWRMRRMHRSQLDEVRAGGETGRPLAGEQPGGAAAEDGAAPETDEPGDGDGGPEAPGPAGGPHERP